MTIDNLNNEKLIRYLPTGELFSITERINSNIFSSRFINALFSNQICNYQALLSTTDVELQNIKNLGKKCFTEFLEFKNNIQIIDQSNNNNETVTPNPQILDQNNKIDFGSMLVTTTLYDYVPSQGIVIK